MKYLFKLYFCLLLSEGQARDIILISFKDFPEKAKLVETLLQREIHIPKNLITLSERENPCQTERNAAFHICIDASGEMIILKRDEELAREAFAIFKQGSQQEGNGDEYKK